MIKECRDKDHAGIYKLGTVQSKSFITCGIHQEITDLQIELETQELNLFVTCKDGYLRSEKGCGKETKIKNLILFKNMKSQRNSKENVMLISDFIFCEKTNIPTKRASKLAIKGGSE